MPRRGVKKGSQRSGGARKSSSHVSGGRKTSARKGSARKAVSRKRAGSRKASSRAAGRKTAARTRAGGRKTRGVAKVPLRAESSVAGAIGGGSHDRDALTDISEEVFAGDDERATDTGDVPEDDDLNR